MPVTLLGLVVIPLCLAFSLQPVRLLQLLLLASTFEAAAILVLGGFGLQPNLLPAVLFIAFVLLQLLLGVRYSGEREAWRAVLPFLLVTLWALLGAAALPQLFAGEVLVWPQKPEPPFIAVPLAPSAANVTQSLYMAVNCVLLITSALFLSQARMNPERVLNAYLASGYLAVGISAWQLASKLAGVPFPEAFFYSNPGWAILSDQGFGNVPRITGPFSEPAALASYLAGIVCCTGWMMLHGHAGRNVRVLLALGLGTMLLSTSTTGFGVLAMLAVGLPAYAMLRGSSRLLGRLSAVGFALAAAVGFGALVVSALLPGVASGVEEVLSATLSKQDSSSYQERTSTDTDSLAVVLPTYGLGVGWGSNRSSSLLPGLLANLGIYGTLGVVWFVFGVARLARRARRLARGADLRAIDGATGAVAGVVAAALLSSPSITSATFYLLLGLLIGTSARLITAASMRPAARPMPSLSPRVPS